MTSSPLALRVTNWLLPIVPAQIQIESADGHIITVANQDSSLVSVDMTAIAEQPGLDLSEGYRRALYAALSTVQDFISEELHEPWPEAHGAFAMPEVRIDASGVISAGYVARGSWILRMPDFEG
jgi:hypothetical protein